MEGGQIFPSGVNIPLFWRDTTMDIWLLKAIANILACRKSYTAFPRASSVMHNSIRSCFTLCGIQLCKLFSIEKCFIFKEDLAFRVSEKLFPILGKYVDVLAGMAPESWVQEGHGKPILTQAEGGITRRARLGSSSPTLCNILD